MKNHGVEVLKVGDRILRFGTTLLIPPGQDASLAIDLSRDGRISNITIAFEDNGGSHEVEILAEGEYDGRIVFKNWNSPLGVSLIEPSRLARISEHKWMYFLASNYRVGQLNQFSIQLLEDE